MKDENREVVHWNGWGDWRLAEIWRRCLVSMCAITLALLLNLFLQMLQIIFVLCCACVLLVSSWKIFQETIFTRILKLVKQTRLELGRWVNYGAGALVKENQFYKINWKMHGGQILLEMIGRGVISGQLDSAASFCALRLNLKDARPVNICDGWLRHAGWSWLN